MTHHDKNLDELAKKEGLNSEKVVDYSGVDQGVDSQPKMSEVSTFQPAPVETPKTKGKGKGKKGKKVSSTAAAAGTGAPKTIKDKIHCSHCSNLMLQSSKLNYESIPSKKIPKDANGKAILKSPGQTQGVVGGVLCDDCKRAKEEGKPVMLYTAIVERADGEVGNVPLSELTAE